MKRRDIFIVLITILLAWLPFYMGVWDKTKPVMGRKARFIDDDIRANNLALETAFDAEHDFTTGSTQTGAHDVNCITSFAILDGAIDACDIAGDAITFVKLGCEVDEDAMGSDSATLIPTQQSVKAYVDSGTVTMTNKTLTSAVLNTAVSGTAVLDEDNMTSDSATQVATQQSIKAYVDAQLPDDDAFGSWASKANNTQYVAASDGIVMAFGGTSATTIQTPVGTNRHSCSAAWIDSAWRSVPASCPVKKGDTWKVTGYTTVYWLPIGG